MRSTTEAIKPGSGAARYLTGIEAFLSFHSEVILVLGHNPVAVAVMNDSR